MIKRRIIAEVIAPWAQKIGRDYVGPILAAGFVILAVAAALFGLRQLNWVLALIPTLVLAALLWYLLIAADRAFLEKQPTRVNVAILTFSVLLAALVFAWFSYLLHIGFGLYHVTLNVGEEVTPGLLLICT